MLRQLGFPFEVAPSQAEETVDVQLSPHEICQLNAYRKARSISKLFPDFLVLGADTLVYGTTGETRVVVRLSAADQVPQGTLPLRFDEG